MSILSRYDIPWSKYIDQLLNVRSREDLLPILETHNIHPDIALYTLNQDYLVKWLRNNKFPNLDIAELILFLKTRNDKDIVSSLLWYTPKYNIEEYILALIRYQLFQQLIDVDFAISELKNITYINNNISNIYSSQARYDEKRCFCRKFRITPYIRDYTIHYPFYANIDEIFFSNLRNKIATSVITNRFAWMCNKSHFDLKNKNSPTISPCFVEQLCNSELTDLFFMRSDDDNEFRLLLLENLRTYYLNNIYEANYVKSKLNNSHANLSLLYLMRYSVEHEKSFDTLISHSIINNIFMPEQFLLELQKKYEMLKKMPKRPKKQEKELALLEIILN